MADAWNDPNSALSGEEDVGSTLEAMVKFYCFHVSPPHEVKTFLFGVQSIESATELMKRANALLQKCQSISPHLLPSHGNRMLYFFSGWLMSDMSRDVSPDIKSRMALMMRLYEENVSQVDRATQRELGISKAGAACMTMEEIMELLKTMKQPEPVLTLASKPRVDVKDICSYSQPKALIGVAEALTLLTTMAFQPVSPGDFYVDKSPRLTFLANLFDRVSYWVATSIVKSSHPAKAISFFISLGSELMKMANYDMLLAVLTGLGNIAVTRLTEIWGDVSPKKVQKFHKLEEFMDPAGGYKNYRTKLRDHPQGRPCIPYFALCLRDMVYIRDGAPTFLENPNDASSTGSDSGTPREKDAKRLLNVRKIHLLGKCVLEFFEKLDVSYELNHPNLAMLEQIRNVQVMDDDKLFSESLKKQPPPVDFNCFQLNPDFFSTIIIEKGIEKELAVSLADKLSELSLEQLAALDRKSIKQLGVTKLKDILTVLNAVHTAIGVPPFLLQPAHSWSPDDVVEWASLSDMDKSVVKKLKEKKIDGVALMNLSPEKVKELVSDKYRRVFQEHLSELQNKSGLALSLRTKLQTKMKKDEISKDFSSGTSSGDDSFKTPSLQLSKCQNSPKSQEKFQPLAGPRGIVSEDASNTISNASEDCLTDEGGETSLSFIQIDENMKQISKLTIPYSPDSTIFKLRFHAKKKFGIKPSFYGVAENGVYFSISNDTEMSQWLKTSKPKMVYVTDAKTLKNNFAKG